MKREAVWLVGVVVVIAAIFFGVRASQDHTPPPLAASASAAASSPASGTRKLFAYAAAPEVGDPAQYRNLRAVIETEKGDIVIAFYPQEAPKTVASFVTLARDGFYDGLKFHRVEPGFVVQGGDPTGLGAGGPGYSLPAEFNSHKHVRGTVAMARTSDPNSAGSQFYICLAATPHLDGQYTVFGQVIKGMENVDKLVVGDRMLKIRIVSNK